MITVRMLLVERERLRKEQQLLAALQKRGHVDLAGWRVITTLSKNNNFYTRFENDTTNQKSRTIKWVVDNTVNRQNPGVPNHVHAVENPVNAVECGICQESVANSHRFLCGHWHCYECLKEYFKCDSDVLIDSEYHQVVCPSCKMEDSKTLINLSEIDSIADKSGGIIPKKTVDNLSSMMINLSIKDEIYSCISPTCPMKWILDDLQNVNANKYEIKCPECHLHQCSKCSIPWNIHGQKCSDVQMDTETIKYLSENCVKCPGQCGQYIQKYGEGGNDEIRVCNVLKCLRDRVYICNLCGELLDSSDFNIYDNNHSKANQHFWNDPKSSCYQHLFTPKKVWLSQLKT